MKGPGFLPRQRVIHILVHSLCAVLLVLWTATPAFADPEPELISATPQAQAFHRSVNVPDVRANYDKDLLQGSKMELRDGSNALVPGTSGLDGPDSPTLGKRTIRFQPSSSLPEGPYTAHATAYAASGAAVDSWSFVVDDTAPVAPTITSPANGALVFDQPVLLRGTGEPNTHLLVLEDGDKILEDWVTPAGTFNVQLPYPPEDGVTHTITVRLRDTAGNIGADTPPRTFRHDSITVIPEITMPSENAFVGSTSVTIAGYAKANSTVTVSEGASPVATAAVNGSGNWSTSATFTEGVHTISATSFDGAVTDGPSPSRSFTVDVTLPAAPVILQPTELQSLASSTVTVAGTAEPLARIEIREGALLRGTTSADAAGNWSTSIGFGDGSHTIGVRAFDRAGNGSATANRTFSIDSTAPARPVIDSPTDGTVFSTNNVPIVGRAEPNADVLIVRGTVTVGTTTADGAGNWATTITFADGAYTVVAFAEDAAGNRSEQSLSRSFAVDTVAPAAPIISQPGPGQTLTNANVRIAGTAEQTALVVVKEGATTLGSAAAATDNTWSITVTLPLGSHTITATAQDNAGNLSIPSPPRTFTVSVTPGDTTPPDAPVLTNPTNGSVRPAAVSFAGNAEPGTTLSIWADLDLLTTTTVPPNGSWTVSASMEDGDHEAFATARDAAGNISPFSNTVNFTVDATRPTVAITTPSESIFLLADETVIAGDADDERNVARVELEYFNLLGQRTLIETAQTCTGCPGPSVTWEARPDLLPGVYTVDAYAIDQAGNRSLVDTIRIVRL